MVIMRPLQEGADDIQKRKVLVGRWLAGPIHYQPAGTHRPFLPGAHYLYQRDSTESMVIDVCIQNLFETQSYSI
jgi:hypothetical protein